MVALQQFLLQQSYMIVIFWLQGFTKVTFEHCHREENVVAHELAKFSFRSSSLASGFTKVTFEHFS
jgi:hypothetical protein